MSNPESTSKDQAQGLRDLMRTQVRSAKLLAVTSGKGGVGKTNVAVNLSIALASKGLRVLLVDVDLGLANADLLMNLQPRVTLAHVLSGSRALEDVVTPGPGGIRFIAGAGGAPEWANLSDFERRNLIHQLRKLDSSTDMVVLDCGAGISRNVLGFAMVCDEVMVVTTPQPPALTDAYATVKALVLDHFAGRIGIFVNMSRDGTEASATFGRLASVAQKFLNFSVADRGFMLHDTAVESAVRARCPFVLGRPRSQAGLCIEAVAEALGRECSGKGRESLLRRVVGLFA